VNVIDALWNHVKDDLYVTREEFVRSLDGYALHPEFNDMGQMIGVVISKGPHFHFATFGVKWKLTKAMLAKWPGSLIDKYGYAETFTPLEDTRQQRFNQRVGFVETKRDDQYVHYKIERVRSCQSSPL
jgi:hypothetical protein